METLIAPSILSADFANMGRDINAIVEAGADLIHCDVMDGMFVPNISFGFKMISDIRKETKAILDVHLMIAEPERYIERFAKAGSDIITIHYEACKKPVSEVLDSIRALGVKSCVSIKPDTPTSVLKELLPHVDMVLLMSVYPGFGGQKFIPESIGRAKEISKMIKDSGFKIDLEIDGGITLENIKECKDAGVNVFVAGSTVFNYPDRKEIIKKLKDA